ncbi:MAG TPA: HAD family acid phosphatase [Gemmatimonadaceae bacterium]|nr:HAD family acid phosphatase [Gemmatimonadaceae bacterium]
MRRILVLVSLIGGAAACAPATIPATQQPAPATAPATATQVPGGIRWFAAAAEQRAAYVQAYRLATSAIERAAQGRAAGSWAVILDADETVIDNSPYEIQQARIGVPYDSASWDAWVKRGAARALPGAVAFTSRVQALGGHVVIVTNRDQQYCGVTRENILRVGVPADEVLCRTDRASGSKDPRFDAVQAGTAPSTLPPLNVLMWVGDNIQDFPHLSQAIRTAPDSALAGFGEKYIVLPNPMYGSWEGNPVP